MIDLTPLGEAIRSGQRDPAKQLTQQAIDQGVPPRQVLDAMVGAMDEVGRRFQNHEIFVPEMLIASRAMKEALGLLEPILVEAGIKPEHTAVIGTVQGDLHDIGKNLVAMMWKGANFAVHD
ncbi:MAG: B12-binding domain-containing protein, partial [Phycisphaeraceae bacterium]